LSENLNFEGISKLNFLLLLTAASCEDSSRSLDLLKSELLTHLKSETSSFAEEVIRWSSEAGRLLETLT